MIYLVVDFVFVVVIDGVDVFLDYMCELVMVVDLVDLVGELRVLDKGVVMDGFVVFGGLVDEVVSLVLVVLVLVGVEIFLFYVVFGSDLIEVGFDNGGVLVSLKMVLIGGSVIEFFVFGFEECVDVLGSLMVFDGGSCWY